MRGSRDLTGRSPLASLGEPDTHSALRGAAPETGIPCQLPNMRSLRTGLLFWRGNLSRFCVILTPVTDVTGVRQRVKKASQSLPPAGGKRILIIFCRGAPQGGLSCPFGAIHLLYLTENTTQAASVRFVRYRRTNRARGRLQSFCQKRARPFFDSLSHASDQCHRRENPPDERYSVLIRAQIPTDFRTKHGRKSFRCPIQRGISTALRPLFVTERNRRSRLLARSSVRYSSACASCPPRIMQDFYFEISFR